MKIKIQDYKEAVAIELQGELESDYTEQLGNNIAEVVAKKKHGIVIDMKGVSFIDSEGLEKLLWARDYCNENRCQLRLAGLDENCCKILEITCMDKEFVHYVETAEAVKSFV